MNIDGGCVSLSSFNEVMDTVEVDGVARDGEIEESEVVESMVVRSSRGLNVRVSVLLAFSVPAFAEGEHDD